MKIADDSASIAKRLKEIEGDRVKQTMGVPIDPLKLTPEEDAALTPEALKAWPMWVYDPRAPGGESNVWRQDYGL